LATVSWNVNKRVRQAAMTAAGRRKSPPRYGAGATAAARALTQQAAGRLGQLTDADREQLRLEKEEAEGSIVADRLISWNGAISLLMGLSSVWVVRNSAAARRLWRRLGGRSRP
jgi:hypothetical protein